MEAVSVQIDVSREEQIFECGESAEFTISVLDSQGSLVRQGTLEVHFQKDFRETVSRTSFRLAEANPVRVRETSRIPLFLSLTASFKDDPLDSWSETRYDESVQTCGAAFSPEKIQPGQEMPADFWEFWQEGLARQNQIPESIRLEEIPSHSTNSMGIFRMTVPTLDGEYRYGWLALPKKHEGPFPALVMVPGAGPGSGPVRSHVSRGTAVFMLNVFPYPTDLNPQLRREQFERFEREECGGRRYVWKNGTDREKYFHRNSILAAVRASFFLASHPLIDASRMGFVGVSQGGFYGLALGALCPCFSGIVSSIPGYCDHGAIFQGRSPGGAKLYDNLPAESHKTAPYFDGVNFARFVQVPIRVTVGFRDTICNPSTVCAAFNQIPAKDKFLGKETQNGHETGQKHQEAQAWLLEKLRIPQ